ncbi:MAG: hypothetical protein J7601_08300, partial [Chloroflexi bacterium]|nr:hypothetical protein [Chloroflexota bacterium]
MRKRTRPALSTLLARLSPCSRWALKVGYSDRVGELGGQIVGLWPTEGYEFTHSDAVVDEGCFEGLAISISHAELMSEWRLLRLYWWAIHRQASAKQLINAPETRSQVSEGTAFAHLLCVLCSAHRRQQRFDAVGVFPGQIH